VNYKKSFPSFTLIELLIVIAIIGILAGVVLAVIDPAKQRRKSKESVMQANLAKACLALVACKTSSTTMDTATCDTWPEIGATNPSGTPTGANYYLTGSYGTGATNYNHIYSRLSGTNCYMICLVFNNFQSWLSKPPGYVHTTGWNGSDCSAGT